MNPLVPTLQKQLHDIELQFGPLRKAKLYDSPQWADIAAQATAVRKQLFDLTGDWYGNPKVKKVRPDDDVLTACYDTPEDVPPDVMAWVRRNSALLTSDATDAVRWARIIDTQGDERYPEGPITLYRAIGRGEEMIDEIRPGDWVSTSLAYVQDHLRRWLDGQGSILELEVDGCDVLVSPTGNDEEAIFAPMELSGPVDAASQRKAEQQRS